MASTLLGSEYTVTATATTLTTALGAPRKFFSHCVFRAGSANAGTVYIGRSDVTATTNRLIFLAAGESFAVAIASAFSSTDDWFIIGTASDKLHIIGLGG